MTSRKASLLTSFDAFFDWQVHAVTTKSGGMCFEYYRYNTTHRTDDLVTYNDVYNRPTNQIYRTKDYEY